MVGGRPARKDPLASLKMASMMDMKPVLPAGKNIALRSSEYCLMTMTRDTCSDRRSPCRPRSHPARASITADARDGLR